MKICLNCLDKNNDEAENCHNCGAKFEAKEPHQDSLKSDLIPTSHKWYFWFGAWGMVIIMSLVINPIGFGAFYAFPLGLLAWLPNGAEKAIEAWMLIFPIVAGWIIYVLPTAILFLTKRRTIFILVYMFFCILLVLNVVGCKRVMEAVKEIH